jgi:hypothetical protein
MAEVTLTSGYGTGLTQKQKNAVNIIQTPFVDIGQTWAAGAIGTGAGNKAYRHTDATTGLITTEIHIDLTGLTGDGTQNKVIGIKADAPDAYLYRNVVANNGVLFKTEISCIELPAGGGTVDVNFVWAASATLGYNDAGGTTFGINSGTWVAGNTLTSYDGLVSVTSGTANHYLYLTDGDGNGDDSVFTAGQYVIKLYGYKVR